MDTYIFHDDELFWFQALKADSDNAELQFSTPIMYVRASPILYPILAEEKREQNVWTKRATVSSYKKIAWAIGTAQTLFTVPFDWLLDSMPNQALHSKAIPR